jgi:hypothetical protein
MPLLTLFTAPKPFTNPHISTIQRNALRSWQALGDAVEIVMIGNEIGMAEVATELGMRHIPQVRTNSQGTPLIGSIFELGRQQNDNPYLAYVNADVVLLPDLLDAIRLVGKTLSEFLLIGQRWDLEVTQALDPGENWSQDMREWVKRNGILHSRTGSDYFVFPRACFIDVPDFAVGRARWDNWMIFHAREQGCPVVDASQSVMVVHQNHDYSHLPGGQSHYKLPESDVNLKLAGGRRTVFQMDDSTHEIRSGQVNKVSCTWKRFWREVEIWPLLSLHSKKLGWLFYAIFHPCSAFLEVRGWLTYKLKKRKVKA